jgi:hypothetical protein
MTSALEGGRLSAIRTGPRNILVLILRGWVDPEHMELLDATEKFPINTTGDLTRELPTTPPQTFTPPVTGLETVSISLSI